MDIPPKIDDELCKNLIENQDILLSSNATNNYLEMDFFTLMQDDTNPNQLIDFNQEFDQSINETYLNHESSSPVDQSSLNEKLGIRDEIIDSDLFEILRAEDPDVVSFIESLGNTEQVFKPSYLPQISFDSTNKVLGEVPTLDQNDSNNKQYSVIDLKNDLKQENQTPPRDSIEEIQPVAESEVTPSRVSLRLIKRRSANKNKVLPMKPKKEPKRLTNLSKRKRSDDESLSEHGSLSFNDNSNDNMKSVDNSVGYESDEHIYFDDDDFNSQLNENSNEREFQNFVFNYNKQNQSNLTRIQLDPAKKDANKEAATRYRLKKLSEKDQMFETRMLLEKENDEVKRRCELVQTEINYLKNLLVQMLLTKGVLGDKMSL